MFALGQIEVVEAESTIVPAEQYPRDGYFDALSDQQSNTQIFDDTTSAAVSSAASDADILLQLQSLQAELRQLRGLVEEQRHAIEMLDRKLIDDYLDLDHRLSVVNQSQVEAKPAPDKEELSFSFVPLVTAQPAVNELDQAEPSLSIEEEAKKAYLESYQLVKDREFERAQASMAGFIKRYPSSSYIPNAYFWLGELQYLAMELPLSRDSFLSLIEQYPQHKKVAEAKFKLGKVYHQLGQSAKAKSTLESVLSDHAESTAANPAREYLNSNLR
tara:strand:+ start:10017 stop:10835 length:819 start_codon:yes stop_codon:yes gene_type:complete